MQEYRVYWFDGEGHVEQAEWIDANDDESVIEAINEKPKGASWEIWRGPRRIASSGD